MSDSRDSSPDWLRSFQVPSGSPLTLSSDSEPLHDHSPSIGDKTNDEGSPPESPTHPDVSKSKRKSPRLGKSRAESSPTKTSEAAALKIEDRTPSRRKKSDKQKAKEGHSDEKKIVNDSSIGKHIDHKESIHSIWTLSSDSKPCQDDSPKRAHSDQVETSQQQMSQLIGEGECEDRIILGNDGKSPSKRASIEKSSQKPIDVEGHTPKKGKKTEGSAKGRGKGEDGEAEEEENSEKLVEPNVPNVSSSRLPLMLSEKVHRTKALIECQGDSVDLSGDVGAVGRVIVSDSPSGDQEMYLDLKGTIYKTSIVPCRTFCVVSFGQSEAKVEAIMNDFILLKPQSNVYEAETMVEGTLDGFSFDSDEEAGKTAKATHETDQNDHAEEPTNGKSKGKGDKKSGAEKKRARSTGKPQSKAVKKKTVGSKKAKTKK